MKTNPPLLSLAFARSVRRASRSTSTPFVAVLVEDPRCAMLLSASLTTMADAMRTARHVFDAAIAQARDSEPDPHEAIVFAGPLGKVRIITGRFIPSTHTDLVVVLPADATAEREAWLARNVTLVDLRVAPAAALWSDCPPVYAKAHDATDADALNWLAEKLGLNLSAADDEHTTAITPAAAPRAARHHGEEEVTFGRDASKHPVVLYSHGAFADSEAMASRAPTPGEFATLVRAQIEALLAASPPPTPEPRIRLKLGNAVTLEARVRVVMLEDNRAGLVVLVYRESERDAAEWAFNQFAADARRRVGRPS